MASGPKWKKYKDFVLKIERAGADVYRVEAQGPTGEAETTFSLPFDEKDIEIFLLKVGRPRQTASRGRVPEPMQPTVEFGNQLYEAILSGAVRDIFIGARHDAEKGDYGLRLRLRLADVPELADLPWEFLYDGRDFLALSADTPLVRYLDLPNQPRPMAVELPLRILVTVSAPHDLPPIDVEQEQAKIQEALGRLQTSGRVQILFSTDATLKTLQRTMRRAKTQGSPFHVWHYIGHGGYDQISQSSVLFLTDEGGMSYPIGGFQLGTLFSNHPETRLSLLNACEGARPDREDPFAGVSAALVERGIPAVIGMQFEISDPAAIAFSSEFYTALVDGLPVDAALTEARRAVFFLPNWVEWATPVLYLRAADGEIFDLGKRESVRPEISFPKLDFDQERRNRIQDLYDKANSAYWLTDWETAARYFQALAEQQPDYKDVDVKLEEALRQVRWQTLYEQAQTAMEGEDWGTAQTALESIVTEAPDYKDAARSLEVAKQRLQLQELYAEARQLFQAGQWKAVIRIFTRIREIDPEYPDPQGLLEDAQRENAAQERLKKLKSLYRRALKAMDAGQWEEARKVLNDVQELEPGYEQAAGLLTRVEEEIAALEAEHPPVEPVKGVESGMATPALDAMPATPSPWLASLKAVPRWLQAAGALLVLAIVIGLAVVLARPSRPDDVPATEPVAIVLKTDTARPPLTDTPTPTRRPTATTVPPTPVVVLPVLAGTPGPLVKAAITAANAAWVTQLARWGDGSVEEIALSPDGELVAVASSLGIYFYDSQTLARLRFIETGSWVSSVAFSPDSATLASGYSDGGIRLWRVADGAPLETLEGHTSRIYSMAFSPDGATLASGSLDDTVRLWRVTDGSLLHKLDEHTDNVYSVAFSPDGATLASGSWDETVRLWRVADGGFLRTLEEHTAGVYSVAFSPDGATLASGSADDTVRLWRVANGSLMRTLDEHTSNVYSVAFSPDGATLASGSFDETVRLWRVADGSSIRTLEGHAGGVWRVAFSPDGATLASGSWDETVRLWRVADGSLLRTLEGHTDSIYSVAFSPGSATLASGSLDDKVRLWRVADGSLLHKLDEHTENVYSVAFSPGGATLASGSADDTVRLWRRSDGALLGTLEEHTGPVYSVAFSPDGATLASGSLDDTVRLWRASDGTLLHTLEGHTETVYSVDFSPDGETLASGSRDNTVRLWRASNGSSIQTLEGHTDGVWSVAFSPDGATLASGSWDDTVRLWRVADGSLLRTLEGHTSSVFGLVFSPDGEILAAGLSDGNIHLWQVSDGATLGTLAGHTSTVLSIAFSAEGAVLASGSSDGTLRLWGVLEE